jgi:hypothetical protein
LQNICPGCRTAHVIFCEAFHLQIFGIQSHLHLHFSFLRIHIQSVIVPVFSIRNMFVFTQLMRAKKLRTKDLKSAD